MKAGIGNPKRGFFFIQTSLNPHGTSAASHIRITSAFCQSQCLAAERHCCHGDTCRECFTAVFQTCALRVDAMVSHQHTSAPAHKQGGPKVCLSQLCFPWLQRQSRSRKNIPFINITGRKTWRFSTGWGGCDCSRPEWLWQPPTLFV